MKNIKNFIKQSRLEDSNFCYEKLAVSLDEDKEELQNLILYKTISHSNREFVLGLRKIRKILFVHKNSVFLENLNFCYEKSSRPQSRRRYGEFKSLSSCYRIYLRSGENDQNFIRDVEFTFGGKFKFLF